jgi:N-acetylneuraminate synthase
MKKPYVIAEIGVNFYDTAKELNILPLDAAKLYIKEAANVGIDAVKFQSYKAETIAAKDSPAYWDLSKEPTTSQYELFKKLDGFNKEDYQCLCDYAKEIGIDFMSTPFDYDSADYLENMVDIYKISSSDITNIPFIRHIARKGKPIYLSVGASYLYEVDEAVHAIQEEGNNNICLLHCVLSYPTRNEDANLNIIRHLRSVYPDLLIGYSDHTLPDPSMTILTTAYLLGAEVIEKHFTLNKCLTGNDHYHAGDPSDFKKAINNFSLIREIVGEQYKTVLPCEMIPRKEARRSLVLKHEMKKGDTIQKKDLIPKRPGTGISPKYTEVVIGRQLRSDLPKDSILKWENI